MRNKLENIKFVSDNSVHVQINQEKIDIFVKNIDIDEITKRKFTDDYGFDSFEKYLNFFFFFNSINFSYWKKPKWELVRKGETYAGASALAYCMYDIVKNTDTNLIVDYFLNITLKELSDKLMGTNQIPYLLERWRIIRSNAQILKYEFGGNVEQIIKRGGYNTDRILNLMIKFFPSFDDRGLYRGREILLHKRAQLFISMIYNISKEKDYINNIEVLTAFADYRLPQLLRYFGILTYSSESADRIDRHQFIEQNSMEEIEIRANTIWAIELMKNTVNTNNDIEINSKNIDNYLWLLNKEYRDKMKPQHLTPSIYY